MEGTGPDARLGQVGLSRAQDWGEFHPASSRRLWGPALGRVCSGATGEGGSGSLAMLLLLEPWGRGLTTFQVR